MAKIPWRNEVAELLEQCAAALRNRNDRQAIASLGTAIGYLQQAEENGDRTAIALLGQTGSTTPDDRTQRFSYAPGELEALVGSRRG
jgi:hypothetical protein